MNAKRLAMVLLGVVQGLGAIGCGPPGSQLPPPPAELGLDPFYRKYVDSGGIPIVSSEWVRDAALTEADRLIEQMLSKRPDLRETMVQTHTIVAIIGEHEQVTDIPEYRNLYEQFPGTDWNRRARGLGATPFINVTSTSEENLLCYLGDPYRGESVLVHEFAHSVMNMGFGQVPDLAFYTEILRAYAGAREAGRWDNTYAATNADEYWAEGAQSWFDTNLQAIPTNGIHNDVNTRDELKAYDPLLADLQAQAFGDDAWRYQCPASP